MNAKDMLIPHMSDTKQILLTRRSPAYWRVTINHPPLNIFGPDTIPQLNEVLTAVETDENGVLSDSLRFPCENRGYNQPATGSYWFATFARHARAAEPRTSCVDRLNSGTRDRCWK